MRLCKCGGQVREHQLTNNRYAWTCGACGRYEIFGEQVDEIICNARTTEPRATDPSGTDRDNGLDCQASEEHTVPPA